VGERDVCLYASARVLLTTIQEQEVRGGARHRGWARRGVGKVGIVTLGSVGRLL
jgi:hypothetical protein